MNEAEFKSLLKRAEANDPDAMLKVAIAFREGDGTDLKADKFVEWATKAADLGSREAMLKLALAYRDGDGVEPNVAEFLEWIRKSAAAKNSDAMRELALAYRDGDGVEPSIEEFLEWIRKSAAAKNSDAMRELAYAYRDGLPNAADGTKRFPDDMKKPDEGRYIDWLQKAAKLNNKEALYELAVAYKEGVSVEVNEKQFFTLMKKAAKEGYADAMYDLAFAYRDGTGLRRSSSEAFFTWLKEAANLKQRDAMLHLAFAYKNGKGTLKDDGLFFQQLKEAADAGQKDAMFHLAIAYRDGEGVPPDDAMFFSWMDKAAREEIPAAMYRVAMAYWTARGTSHSFEDFLFWIRRSLKAGYPRAFIAAGIGALQAQAKESGVPVDQEDLIALNDDLDLLFDKVSEIKRRQIVKMKGSRKEVAHFTTFKALTSMLPEKPDPDRAANRLRLYNFAYLNDPMEGKKLRDKEIPGGENLDHFFSGDDDKDNPISWEAHESSVYVGSFSLRGDDLDLWRAYGQNGKGYCIVTPLSAFDEGESDPPHGGEIVNVSQKDGEPADYLPTTLYFIQYKDADVKRTLDELEELLKNIAKKKTSFSKEGKREIDRIVRLVASHILYLYKNKQYSTEKEARLLAELDIGTEFLKFDKRAPERVFVESVDFLFKEKGSRIIIGPTVADKTEVELNLKYRLSRNGNLLRTTQVVRSKLEHLYR